MPVPAITSASTASGTVGSQFSYQTTASNAPTNFWAFYLPPQLSINAATGLISGELQTSGTFAAQIFASNASGQTGPFTLTIAVAAVPTPTGGTLFPAPFTRLPSALHSDDIGTMANTVAAGNDSRFAAHYTPEMFGAVADGTSHPLSAYYGSLAAAQAFYPDAVALSDEIDWAAAQKAVGNATIIGAKVRLPVALRVHNRTLTVNGNCTIEGEGVQAIPGATGSTDAAFALPTYAPYLLGSVILMTAGATNAITITGAGRCVHLRDFGVRFADSIRFANTGHGVYAVPPTASGAYDNGLQYSNWSSVLIWGHDGNHYGFYFVNAQNNNFAHLYSWGGGGTYHNANGIAAVNCFNGNAVFTSCMAMVICPGSAHGIYCTQGNSSSTTILMNLNRYQVYVRDSRDTGLVTGLPAAPQKTILIDPSTALGGSCYISIVGTDFETNCPGVTYSIPVEGGILLGPGLLNDYSGGTNLAVQDIRMDTFRLYQGAMTYTGGVSASAGDIITTANVSNVGGRVAARRVGAALPNSSQFTSGDMAAIRDSQTGVLFFGSDGLGFLYRTVDNVAIGPAVNLPPKSSAPATPTAGVTLYVDTSGDLHALHASGTNRVISAH